jgi:hypothetical protein
MAEKRTIELEIQDNSKTLKQQYKEAVVELQKMVSAYGDMSEQAVAAAKKAAELKDQIEDTNDLMKSFKGEGAFIAMNKAMSAVASGFSAVEGGLALIGVEGEAVQETMLKVQAAMALAQGLEGLEDAGRAFKNLGVTAKNALSGIRSGLAATGIGLFVVALGTIVAYWDDIKAAVSGVSEEQKKLNKEAEKNAETSKKQYENFQLQENSLKLQGKSEKEILKIRIDKINASIKDEEIRIKGLEETSKLEIAAAERNQEITKNIIRIAMEGAAFTLRAIAAPFDLLFEGANKLAETLGFSKITTTNINAEISKLMDSAATWTSNLLFDPAKVKADSQATITAAKQGLNQMKSDRDGFLLQIKQGNQQGAQDRVNTEKGAAQEQIDITRQMEEEKNRLMEEGRAKDLDALRIKYKYEQQEADKNFKEGKLKKEDYDKLTAQAIESKRLDDKAINDKYDKIEKDARDLKLQEQIKAEDAAWLELQKAKNSQREQELLDLQLAFDEKIAAANGNAEIEKAITDKFNKEYAAINEKYRKEEEEKQKEQDKKDIARKNELRQKTLELTAQSFSALGELAGSFNTKNEKDARKQFQVQKAFNLAAAITNTAMAVTGALTAGGNPIKLATGMQFVEAGIAATVGAANIIKISNSKFGGGANSGGGGNDTNVPTAAPMTANFNTIGSSGINQLAQLQQTPTQAYVVSGEVTSAQALDRNRVQNATL